MIKGRVVRSRSLSLAPANSIAVSLCYCYNARERDQLLFVAFHNPPSFPPQQPLSMTA